MLEVKSAIVGLVAVLLAPLAAVVAPPQAAAAVPVSGTIELAHDLRWALALEPDAVPELSDHELVSAAEWLWYWKNMGPAAPVEGGTEDFIRAGRKANAILRRLMARSPDDSRPYWMLARNNYDTGELLPEEAKERRAALYREMIEVTTTCVTEVDPRDASCWHFLAVGKGRLATTHGVLDAMFTADEVEEAWQRSLDLEPAYVAPNGDPMRANVLYGFGVFYRIVPEWWIVNVIIGTRGDIDKSVQFFREAARLQPYRVEIHKELAVALLCQAERNENPSAKREGMKILRGIVAGRYDVRDRRAFDSIDRRHAAELEAHPERACGYSRDGHQDVSREAAERSLKEQKESGAAADE